VGGMLAAPLASAQGKNLPVGPQLFTLRNELEKDVSGILQAVATMLLSQDTAPWGQILAAAKDKGGGAELLVIEQEQSVEPPIEAMKKDLELYQTLRRGGA
jgi:hypothetical protein